RRRSRTRAAAGTAGRAHRSVGSERHDADSNRDDPAHRWHLGHQPVVIDPDPHHASRHRRGPAKNIYVTEWSTGAIKKITPAGVVTTLTTNAAANSYDFLTYAAGSLWVTDH